MRVAVALIMAAMLYAERPLSAEEQQDVAALRALDQAYASEWMEGDADGVMALFTEDATLVPHHGDAPVKGHDAIREFWFNPVYPPTVVPEWRRQAAEVLVLGDVGIVRGRARLVWEFDGTRTTIPEGNYVLIAIRREEGWRIRMLTWNDDPRSWLQEPAAGTGHRGELR
ncbi:MAG: nuclear transport factor 2 family protein [Woeseiaceae bacterium]|nr:nuclear transport factor 2 family protein [Woeseiaceae bacterium]